MIDLLFYIVFVLLVASIYHRLVAFLRATYDFIIYHFAKKPSAIIRSKALLNQKIAHFFFRNSDKNAKTIIIYLRVNGLNRIREKKDDTVHNELVKQIKDRLQYAIDQQYWVAQYAPGEYVLFYNEVIHTPNISQFIESSIESSIVPLMSKTYTLQSGAHYDLTVNAGINVVDREHFKQYDADQAINHAYKAMVFSKVELNYPTAVYAPAMNDMNRIRKEFLSLSDYNEFHLHYQPVLNKKDYKIVGAEALLRWESKDFGMVPPHVFIPSLLDSKHLLPLTLKVFKDALVQFKSWKEQYDLQFISINISSSLITQDHFYDAILALPASLGLQNSYVLLDITDIGDDVLRNKDQFIDWLTKYRAADFHLSMNHSVMSYIPHDLIRSLDLSTIKLDLDFVHNLDKIESQGSLAKTLISVINSMDIDIAIEGIENNQQLRFFDGTHCNTMQGFLFSKALDPEAFTDYLMHKQITHQMTA